MRRGKIKQDWQSVHMLKLVNGYVSVHGLFSCIFLKFFYIRSKTKQKLNNTKNYKSDPVLKT